jgi:SAM-dependent methyltransferase
MPQQQRSAVNLTLPNVARVYDYVLGGKDHFAADRAAAERIFSIYPIAPLTTLEGRAFVSRAGRYLAGEAGIRQFIDIGPGLPTTENVHQVVHRIAPDARVIYVDKDPVAVAHGQALLTVADKVEMVPGDLLKPDEVLGHPRLRKLIDFEKPVAIFMTNLLQWITDDEDPADAVSQYKRAMPPGSYLAISHCLIPDPEEDRTYRRPVEAICREIIAPLTSRTHAEILRFFDGLELVEPGLVPVTDWRPEVPHLVLVPSWDEWNESLGELSPAAAAVVRDRKTRKWLLAGGIGRKV